MEGDQIDKLRTMNKLLNSQQKSSNYEVLAKRSKQRQCKVIECTTSKQSTSFQFSTRSSAIVESSDGSKQRQCKETNSANPATSFSTLDKFLNPRQVSQTESRSLECMRFRYFKILEEFGVMFMTERRLRNEG